MYSRLFEELNTIDDEASLNHKIGKRNFNPSRKQFKESAFNGGYSDASSFSGGTGKALDIIKLKNESLNESKSIKEDINNKIEKLLSQRGSLIEGKTIDYDKLINPILHDIEVIKSIKDYNHLYDMFENDLYGSRDLFQTYNWAAFFVFNKYERHQLIPEMLKFMEQNNIPNAPIYKGCNQENIEILKDAAIRFLNFYKSKVEDYFREKHNESKSI